MIIMVVIYTIYMMITTMIKVMIIDDNKRNE